AHRHHRFAGVPDGHNPHFPGLTAAGAAGLGYWHESKPSEMTELADLLDVRGVRVRRVAASNKYFLYGPRHAPKLAFAGGRNDAFLEAEFPEAFVRVSLKPALGWMVDLHASHADGWSRVNLGWCLHRRSYPIPGLSRAKASVDEIADFLCRGPKAWDSEPPRGAPQDNPRTSGELCSADASRIAKAVLDQLTAFGFGDLAEGDADTPIESDAFHVEWRSGSKDLSTSEVQRLNGLAAAAGNDLPKRLIVITSGGLTRPATAFADKAKAFAFHLDPTTGRLYAVNSRADEAMPPSDEPGS
ncbi:hypothetical protein ACFY2M_27650, partial [Streptomyces sp. NPDC001276]